MNQIQNKKFQLSKIQKKNIAILEMSSKKKGTPLTNKCHRCTKTDAFHKNKSFRKLQNVKIMCTRRTKGNPAGNYYFTAI